MDSREYKELQKFISKLGDAENCVTERRLVLIHEAILKIEDLRARLKDSERKLAFANKLNEELRDDIRQFEADSNH